MNRDCVSRFGCELIGTYILVFAGTGAIIVNDVTSGTVTHVGIAMTFGLVVMAMIYALGDISGAHMNPVVSLTFWVMKRLPTADLLAYTLAQFIGAILASLTLRILFADHPSLGATIPSGSSGQSFLLEVILTAILMLVVLRMATGTKEEGITAGIAIGGVVALEAMFAGPICGASMNPVRSLAPALVCGNLAQQWIYVFAPTLGSLIAVCLFKLCTKPPTLELS